VAGVIKMVAAMQHGLLPRTLHVETPSQEVDWSSGSISLLTEEVPWQRNGRPRRAGVSSFGVSGTNAHVILEEPAVVDGLPVTERALAGEPAGVLSDGVVPWMLSARGCDTLRAHAERVRGLALRDKSIGVGDIGFSLAGRSSMEDRAVVIGDCRERLLTGLTALSKGEIDPEVFQGVASAAGGRVAFLFTGQGAQRVGMGRELYRAFPPFRGALDEACSELDAQLKCSLLEVMFAEEGLPTADLLRETMFAQAALFALEVSLLALLDAWGVRPDYLIGHSLGELTAAFAAGVFSLADACKLVAARGRLMGALPAGGAMIAVEASEEEALESLAGFGDRVALAAVNGPHATVLSGDEEPLLELAELWERRERKVKRLRVSHAFHSPRMEGMLEGFAEVARGVSFVPPRIPVVSNATGEPATEEICSPGYWVRHVRETVRFADGVRWLDGQEIGSFLEVGPDGVLSAMAMECLQRPRAEEDHIPTVVSTLKAERPETLSLVRALAELWTKGMPLDWGAMLGESGARWVALPTYPFQRQRYWLESSKASQRSDGGRTIASAQVDDGAGSGFWDAVEREDLAGLLNTLRVDDESQSSSLSVLLPSLSAWRRRSQARSLTGGWRYQVNWRPIAVPSPPALSGNWLVAVPEDLGEDRWVTALIDVLRECGARLALMPVEEGGVAREQLAGRLRETIEGLRDAGTVDGVISLLALQERRESACGSVPQGLAGTMSLVQALGDANVTAPLWLLTRCAVSVAPSEPILSAIQAQVWGLGLVAGLEHPQRWGGVLDLPESLDERVGSLLAGTITGSGGEDQLAIRGAGVFARRLVRSPQRDEISGDGWSVPAGTVLITGGTGGLGGHVARWLAGCGAQHMLLVSRGGLDAPGADRLRQELLGMGAEVTVAACDVSDRRRLAVLIQSLPEHRPLSMVVHAAGVASYGALDSLAVEDLEEALSAKVQGALNLDALTEGLDLSEFVMFSSIAGTLGSGLQAPYAAANACLDALAVQRRARGIPATSVAWGPWEGEGMAREQGAAEALSQRGLECIAPHLAIEALQGALLSGETLLAVADVRWETYAPLFASARSRPLIEDLAEVRAALGAAGGAEKQALGRDLRERMDGVSGEERRGLLLELVRSEVERVMGGASLHSVDLKRAFNELGFNSLMAVELYNRLSTATGLELPTTLVFDYPTPVAVAEYLLAEMGGDRLSEGASVESELVGLELALASLQDEAERRRVSVRLRTLLAGLDDGSTRREAVQAQGTATVLEQMQTASDDEIFDFIDQQLGSS
jgi:acyl transferase domain-containing protein/acyl carrier protein